MISENAADIIKQTGLAKIEPTPDIYFGGPVNLEMGLILHDANYNIEGTLSSISMNSIFFSSIYVFPLSDNFSVALHK